ncbi:MAG TPA: hypothetical protein VF587_07250 [Solirubrobacteraceae bacterium]
MIGRDGVFEDDGAFHALPARSSMALVCTSPTDDGALGGAELIADVPASGYTGRPGPPIGGCRERVDLDGPTVSEETRRRLRDVPVCDVQSLRALVVGFAGSRAHRVTLTVDGEDFTTEVDGNLNGGYLFVLPGPRAEGLRGASVLIEYDDGRACATSVASASVPCQQR